MYTEEQINKLQANPKKLAKQLNAALPSFDELAQHEMLPRIIGIGMMLPSKRERIATAVQHMVAQMMKNKWYRYYSVEDNEAVVYDHASREYVVTMEEFEVLTKIMFTQWLGIQLDFTQEQQDLYCAFKWQSKMYSILN